MRVLLCSGTVPGSQGVGGTFLSDLLSGTELNVVAGYFTIPTGAQALPGTGLAAGMRTTIDDRPPYKLPSSRLGKAGRLIDWWIQERSIQARHEALLKSATRLGRELQVTRIWGVLDSPEIIALAAPLAEELGVPLFAHVWDDISQIVSSHGLDRLTAHRTKIDFDRAMNSAIRCAVISEPMAKYYEAKYGIKCVVLRHGISPIEFEDPGEDKRLTDTFKIAFVGTMNAPCAFASLIGALDTVNWKIGLRQVELYVTGPRLDMRSMRAANVRYFGWQDTVAETIALIRSADLAYMPQPFDPGQKALAELSFPTKLTTYLAAQLPIFVHAPNYASLAEYHNKFGLGILCASKHPADILVKLEGLITDDSLYSRVKNLSAAAHQRDFTSKRFRQSFEEFMSPASSSVDS